MSLTDKLRKQIYEFHRKLSLKFDDIEKNSQKIADKITSIITKHIKTHPEIRNFRIELEPKKILDLKHIQTNYILSCNHDNHLRQRFVYTLVDLQSKICINHDYAYQISLQLTDGKNGLIVCGTNILAF